VNVCISTSSMLDVLDQFVVDLFSFLV